MEDETGEINAASSNDQSYDGIIFSRRTTHAWFIDQRAASKIAASRTIESARNPIRFTL